MLKRHSLPEAAVGSLLPALCTFLAILCAAPSLSAARTVKVGVYENPPKVLTEPDGTAKGIFVDLLEEAARLEGWEIQYVPGTWHEGLERLKTGEIDLMPDVSWLEERTRIFDYGGVPALSDWFRVYRHRGAAVEGILDMAGRSVGVLRDSIQQKVFSRMVDDFGMEVRITPFDDYGEMFRDLGAGTIDAAITNRFYGVSAALADHVEETGIVFHPNGLFFASPKGMNSDLLEALDRHLKEMKSDPASAYFLSLRRWTGEEPEQVFPLYLKWALAVLAAGVVVFFGISAYLRVEVDARTEEIRKKNAALEKAMADLEKAQAEAIERERLHALGQMASGIAHDFNNILTPILGYSEIFTMRPERLENREEVLKRLKIMHRAARDGTRIVERMREFYKSREISEEPVPVDLNAILQEVVALARPRWEKQMQATEVRVRVETVLGKVPRVLGDPTEMREMFMNLLFNAVDAMPEGGTVTLETGNRDGQVLAVLRDTGTGMTEEVRRNCLQPFFTTKGASGTGMGLSMVTSAVARIGGRVEIESQPGKGTAFLISLPAAEGEGEESGGGAEGPPLRKLTLLAVDDDVRSLESLAETLRADGHRVETATTPSEAMEKLKAGSFDAVFTDHAMPEMTGLALSEEMRLIRPGLPVVMVSSFGESDEAREGSPGSVSVVLRKPASLAELKEALTSLGFAESGA